MSDSARSREVSPIPTRMPVVNGIARRPASAIVRIRTAGTLSGELKWGIPRPPSRSLEVSSMMPIDAEACFSRAISSYDMTPGFRCGRRPVSSMTRIATART